MVAALLIGFGYFSLAFSYKLKMDLILFLCLFTFCIAFGSSSAYLGAVGSTARTWPSSSRGTMLGFHSACYGLSAFLFSLLNASFFAGDKNGD